jgi:CheY-like chemotaxis protein
MTPDSETGAPIVAIVDDEQDIITYLRLALEDSGYRVISTTDPATAMELLVIQQPDLICLDLLMPEQTGVSLYADLVKHPQLGRVPVVILSGLTNREGLPRLLKDAGDLPEPSSFIEKPVDIEQFIVTVRNLLNGAT